MSRLHVITPTELAATLGWTERRVRDVARKLGACRILGRTMIFLPQDVAQIQNAIFNRSIPKPDGHESCVYFVAVRGFIKIGWSENWKSRMSGMQTSNPEPIEVLSVIARPKIFEKTMHRKFAKHRANGEWFTDCPEIRAYIKSRRFECLKRNQR